MSVRDWELIWCGAFCGMFVSNVTEGDLIGAAIGLAAAVAFFLSARHSDRIERGEHLPSPSTPHSDTA